MNPSVSLVLGPGHHGTQIRDALRGAGLLRQVIQTTPALHVATCQDGQLRTTWEPAWPPLLSRLVWGAWRRLPVLGRSEAPRAPLFALWDRLARSALLPCDLLIGWCCVSLRCLVAAREAGARTLLEHPTGHVRAWMAQAVPEYRRHRTTGYSLMPAALRARMEAEIACADQVLLLSSYARDTFLEAGVPKERLLVTLPGVDTERFHPAPEPQPGRRLRVLYAGRLELLKGLSYLLSAWSRLRGLDCELLLCGRVLDEALPLIRGHRGPPLTVLGPLPKEQMPACYRQADVLVMPSLHEGLALVLLEAMACGLPVIATPSSGAGDVITDGVEGFLVPARDEQAIADRIAHLARHPDQARAMGQAARKAVLRRFTWAHYKDRLLSACAAALAR